MKTVDLYRRGSGVESRILARGWSGALSIESFEGSRWRGARQAAPYGYSIRAEDRDVHSELPVFDRVQ